MNEPGMLAAAPDAIVVADEHGCIGLFNPAAERLFGYSAAEIVGGDLGRLFDSGGSAPAGEHWQSLLAAAELDDSKSWAREVNARRASGERFSASLAVGKGSEQGRPRYVAILRDLTAEKADAARIRALEARIAALTRLVLAAEVAAGMAHEINQPLSAIASYAQAAGRFMRGGAPDLGRLEEICRKIDEQARRAGVVVQDLRELIRRPQPEIEVLDLNAVVADVIVLIEADARQHGIPVRAELTRPLPTVRGDAVELQAVLLNLAGNAIEAMRDSAPAKPAATAAPVETPGIGIRTSLSADGRVRVSVADRGPGLAPEQRSRIFEPFVTSRSGRLGLGLSISRTAVEAHKGRLFVEDNPGGGLCFVVELPPGEPGDRQ